MKEALARGWLYTYRAFFMLLASAYAVAVVLSGAELARHLMRYEKWHEAGAWFTACALIVLAFAFPIGMIDGYKRKR